MKSVKPKNDGHTYDAPIPEMVETGKGIPSEPCTNCGHEIYNATYGMSLSPIIGHKKGPRGKNIKICFCGCDKPISKEMQCEKQ